MGRLTAATLKGIWAGMKASEAQEEEAWKR